MKDSKLKRCLVKVYEFVDEKTTLIKSRMCYSLRIMDAAHTIQYIQKHHVSIVRYGDGEFNLIFGRGLKFQKIDKNLAKQLEEVLRIKDKRVLVCIPHSFNTLKGLKPSAYSYWYKWKKTDQHHKNLVKMLRKYRGLFAVYGDAQITRTYIDWDSPKRAETLYPMLKMLWEKKDILIVEGQKTCMGIGNDLFDNAKSIKRILAPATDAYTVIDQLEEAVLRRYNGELVILALGPTATVLASRLSQNNIQALDVGHMDIEYEWYLMGAKEKVAIPQKFVNEVKNGEIADSCQSFEYKTQVIDRIGC